MIFHASSGRVFGRTSFALIILLVSVLAFAVDVAASSSDEVALKHKAERTEQLDLSAYEDELIECSALAGIHTWIGDNLGNDSGAEVRKSLNNDYWINVSKSYLSLAQEASGQENLFPEVGIRMKALAAEYRDLTVSQVEAESWANWHQLIDRCDTWRPNPPAHAFYNNGRKSIAIEDQSTKVAMGSK